MDVSVNSASVYKLMVMGNCWSVHILVEVFKLMKHLIQFCIVIYDASASSTFFLSWSNDQEAYKVTY